MANITVVGVSEDGCMSLSSRAVNAVSKARVVAGHSRHMAWFPQFSGNFLDMSQGFSAWLNEVIDQAEEGDVVILASGDPLFFGIGATLLKRYPLDEVLFIPSQSSAQLAFARLGLSWSGAQFLSCHGRQRAGMVAQMQSGDLFAILTDSTNTPQNVAKHMQEFNETGWKLTVCEQLGAVSENITSFTVQALVNCDTPFDTLNIIIAQRQAPALWGGHGQFACDDSFVMRMPQKGLITKQAVRHLALTHLRIQSHDIVWDIGAGSGSISIESGKFATQGKVYAVECNPSCFEHINANMRSHGTDNVQLIAKSAPDALVDLPSPDAVFIGGSRGAMHDILTLVWDRLNLGGRLVVAAVTMDTVVDIYQWAKSKNLNFDAQLVNISHTQPLAQYLRYQAQNPIHLFSIVKSTDPSGENNE
ncbi:precorrin-6y C5,15-methyltransferase (decarboxylating) subunit CbiE [Vibrio rarus]|uniref:precorrin-6y C5,15-methyltransferase (decarboxylating) subunit CbiE n=1 Tax=Vibrio rarus TaxID=413403 RepID=UPI0021C38434|nr:precorrin-6y C5,15-methyltransferase (decarboxylating) subunit CbiE [Vibrio rarus]